MYALLALLSCAVITDLSDYRIPNSLILLGLFTGLAYRISVYGISDIPAALLGMLIPILFLFPFFLLRGLGAGDLKLLAVAGGFLGVLGSCKCLVASIVIGAVLSLFKVLFHHNLVHRLRVWGRCLYQFWITKDKEALLQYEDSRSRQSVIHFSIPILCGAICVIGGLI